MIRRYLEENIVGDLKDKMVFISGPRQVGKTTLAKNIALQGFPDASAYLNWDFAADRKQLLKGLWQADKKLFILDEIHKYKKWKILLKGEYDKYKDKFQILVTGSARLDIYRKGGDSLLGRYRSYRLHPFSVAELAGVKNKTFPIGLEIDFPASRPSIFDTLWKFGGFPEQVSKQTERSLRRWHQERTDRLIKEDIRDVEIVRDISALQVLVQLLPDKVGSLFSVNSLREDLQVAHKTVSLWVDILEKFYYHFRIYPWQSSAIKSLRKEPKLYLWDWSEIVDPAAKLENIVASHLLKFCHFLSDVDGHKAVLYYLRDKEQREVDFLVCVNDQPWFCVEVKTSSRRMASSLEYFGRRLKIPFLFQVVQKTDVDVLKDNVRTISVDKFLGGFA
jgi:predicted AAA+ superfamily ATPase